MNWLNKILFTAKLPLILLGMLLIIAASASSIPAPHANKLIIDSLESELTFSVETARPHILNELASAYIEVSAAQSLKYSKEALSEAKRLVNLKEQAVAYKNIANSLRILIADYEAALEYCFKALSLAEQNRLKAEQNDVLLLIAEIYKEQGNSYKAIEYYMQSQALSKALSEHEKVVAIYNNIGKVYASIGNEAKAVDYHLKALKLSKDLTYNFGIAESSYWLANVYINKTNLDIAQEYIYEAFAAYQEVENNKEGLAQCHFALGKIYKLFSDYDKALQHTLTAFEYFNSLNQKLGIAKAYNEIGSIYLSKKEHKIAINYLKAGLKVGELLNDKKIIRDAYELLYNCYFELKDYEQALTYKDGFIAISDLIYGEESERRMAELQTRFEIEQKESEISLLKHEKELRELALQEQANFRNFLVTGLALTLIIASLIFYLYQTKRRSNKQLQEINKKINEQNLKLQELNATKDKFFSIISHDLKSPLNSLTSFSGLLINHTDALSKEEIQMLAKDLDKSLKNLLTLLENLLEWSRSQTGNLEIKPEPCNVRELVLSNIELLQKSANNKNITIVPQVPVQFSIMADKNLMNTVIRNLLSNAIKFTNVGGKIEIQATEWKDVIEIFVKDNGIGMSEEVLKKLFKLEHKFSNTGTANEKGTGLGLMLCKEFIESNGGHINVESKEGEGSTFRITVPKAKVKDLQLQSALN